MVEARDVDAQVIKLEGVVGRAHGRGGVVGGGRGLRWRGGGGRNGDLVADEGQPADQSDEQHHNNTRNQATHSVNLLVWRAIGEAVWRRVHSVVSSPGHDAVCALRTQTQHLCEYFGWGRGLCTEPAASRSPDSA